MFEYNKTSSSYEIEQFEKKYSTLSRDYTELTANAINDYFTYLALFRSIQVDLSINEAEE